MTQTQLPAVASLLSSVQKAVVEGQGSVVGVPREVASEVAASFHSALLSAHLVRVVDSPVDREIPYSSLRKVIAALEHLVPVAIEPAMIAITSGGGVPQTPYSIGAAFIRWISEVSERTPVVVILERSETIDDSSAAVVEFCRGRLTADRVLIVVGVGSNMSQSTFPEQLSPLQRELCLAVALDGSLSTLTSVFGEAAIDALSAMQRDGLIESAADGKLLLLGAVSADNAIAQTTISEQRQLRRRLAQAHRALGNADQALLHESEAIEGTDEGVAEQLADFSRRAWARGARNESVHALSKAISRTAIQAQRSRWTIELADRHWNSGEAEKAIRTLSTLSRADLPLDLQVRHRTLAALSAQWERTPSTVSAEVRALAMADEIDDPGRAAWGYVFLANNAYLVGNLQQGVLDAQRAISLAEKAGDVLAGIMATGNLEWNLCLSGKFERTLTGQLDVEAVLALARMAEFSEGTENLVAGQGVLMISAVEERWDDTDRMLAELPAIARRRGVEAAIRFYDGIEAAMLWRRGRLEEALSLGLETDAAPRQPRIAKALGEAHVAHFAASVGDHQLTEAFAQRALATSNELRVPLVTASAFAALGHSHLSRNEIDDAVVLFDRVAAAMRDMGFVEPSFLFWAGDAMEAWVEAGHHLEVDRTIDELRPFVESGRRWVRGVVDRVDALRAPSWALAAPLLESSSLALESLGMRFEVGRTELIRATVQDRFSVPGSQSSFARAERLFRSLGAAGWAQRAHDASARAFPAQTASEPAHVESISHQLSAAEMRVARIVVGGASNKEVASQLFISAKTVDFHLQSIYRKLGIRKRAEFIALYLKAFG